MKKPAAILLTAVLSLGLFAGCSGGNGPGVVDDGDKSIKVAAITAPHAEILSVAGEILEEKGYTLEVINFTDYTGPNWSVENEEADANYFQTEKYMNAFNEQNDAHLVSAGSVHYEPMGIYSLKHDSLDNIPKDAMIAVPEDPVNLSRALKLLDANDIIQLKEVENDSFTLEDIAENPYNVEIKGCDASLVPAEMESSDFAVINGNFAIVPGGLYAPNDALAIEDITDADKEEYENIIAVKEGNENKKKINALLDVLQSEEVKSYMEEAYMGAVVPLF